MRIAVMSDLHTEFYPDGTSLYSPPLPGEDLAPLRTYGPDLRRLKGRIDLLILAGDIGVGPGVATTLRAIRKYLDVPVVFVAGNHEFYRTSLEATIDEIHGELAGGGVHFLDRGELIQVDESKRPVRILGCTLWTDFALFGEANVEQCMEAAGRLISDYSWIGIGGGPESWQWENGRRLLPADSLAFHGQDRSWLEGKLASAFDGETVVVTHMGPSMKSVPERFKTSGLSAAFSSDLDDLIFRTQPVLWVHGHTHDSFDYRIGRTRVVCNPYGYYGRELNEKFVEGLVIEI